MASAATRPTFAVLHGPGDADAAPGQGSARAGLLTIHRPTGPTPASAPSRPRPARAAATIQVATPTCMMFTRGGHPPHLMSGTVPLPNPEVLFVVASLASEHVCFARAKARQKKRAGAGAGAGEPGAPPPPPTPPDSLVDDGACAGMVWLARLCAAVARARRARRVWPPSP